MSVKVTATINVNGNMITIEADDSRELERELRRLTRMTRHLENVEPAPQENLLTEG